MRNIEFKILIVFIVSIGIISCSENRINIKPYDSYVAENFDQYKHIRHSLIDTLHQWRSDSLDCISSIFFDDEWQVDSILLFNEDSTRLLTTINEKRISANSNSDFIKGMVGIKKYDRWHFHLGSNTYVPRSSYQDSIYSPMTFEELSHISHIRVMSRLLKINKAGHCIIDYDEMDNYFYKAYKQSYPNIDKIDSLILSRIAKYRRKKLDVKLIERVKEKRLTTIKPPEPHPNGDPWWKRVFGTGKKKLFETDEWKNRK